ncbi:E3 ubiquitin-protein ligase RNF217-like isoform X3 [Amphiura filiformis]|uniref:E3 ubiquitin-protein ligase RNF217-like isoform X3 n=1 Tax=Amphiura filiformis TaxID=82378 RepID=UPI003B20EEDD
MVNQRLVTMQCPSYACKKYLSREEIAYHLDHASRDKFYRFILEANCEPHMKTCPRCNFVATVDKELVGKKTLSPLEAKVICEQCDLDWCFPCHAPWHDGLTCKEFWKGDRLLKDWAKERHLGIVNAHKCPKCRVFIQRSSGCDHMTCSRCGTEFCYQCGGRFRGIRYFGNHYSRYSIFGCKYRFKPEDPVERKVIRGAIFGCKVLAAPLCLGLAVGAGSLILTFGAIALPIYGGYKLHKRLTNQPPQQPIRTIHYAQPFHGGFDPMDLEGYTLDATGLVPREATILR